MKGFEKDCKIPFKLEWMMKKGSSNFAGIALEDGTKLSYIYMSCNNTKAAFIRYLKSDEGQRVIESEISLTCPEPPREGVSQ